MKSIRPFGLFLIAAISLASLRPCAAEVTLKRAFPSLRFSSPVDLQHAGDGSGRLFVVEQAGRIYVFDNQPDVSSRALFLDITDRVEYGGERGLLGLAFHPQYQENGFFFVNYTAPSPLHTVIARFSVDPNDPGKADPTSEIILLTFNQPFQNHNGGQIAFGPDGYLYIATGDGGSGGDPQGNAQNVTRLLGKILRIDVDNPANDLPYGIPASNPFAGATDNTRKEIYAYGLRNPWRFSFDAVTGWLWAADVGQNSIEEIDIISAGKNYGWNIMEGTACYRPSSGCDTTGLTMPVLDYPQQPGNNRSVTGGYVYRGSNFPELIGQYIYGDYVSGRLWSLTYDGINPPQDVELIDTNLAISSFGVDAQNELYILAFDGYVYTIESTATGVADFSKTARTFALSQNYPNPFNGTTKIAYSLERQAGAVLQIFDVNGRLIRVLDGGIKDAGSYSFTWNGTNGAGFAVPSGVYLYSLRVDGQRGDVKRMVFIK